MEAMRAQGALSELMRSTTLTTWPPIRGRRPDCSEDAVKILILEFGPTYGVFIFVGGV
jgi:hypothetical protein